MGDRKDLFWSSEGMAKVMASFMGNRTGIPTLEEILYWEMWDKEFQHMPVLQEEELLRDLPEIVVEDVPVPELFRDLFNSPVLQKEEIFRDLPDILDLEKIGVDLPDIFDLEKIEVAGNAVVVSCDQEVQQQQCKAAPAA